MKTVLVIALLLITAVCSAQTLTNLEIGGYVVPPHHEPVFPHSPFVSRYRLTADVGIAYKALYYTPTINLWGFQGWTDLRGVEFPASFFHSRWGIQEIGVDVSHVFGIKITDRLSWDNKYYVPMTHNMCCYSWEIGFKYKFK